MLFRGMNLTYKVIKLVLVCVLCVNAFIPMKAAMLDTLKTNELLANLDDSLQHEIENKKPVVLSASDKKHMYRLMNTPITFEDQLKFYVDGAIAFDKRTDFNPFWFINWQRESMRNNFIYEYVPFHTDIKPIVYNKELGLKEEARPLHLLDSITALDTHLENSWHVFKKAREDIFVNHPSLVACHWDDLPDPPAMVDTVFLPLINEVDLGYDLKQTYVGKNHKIEGFKKEVSPWSFKGLSSFHTTETLISNWAKGGQNSVSVLGITNFDANYQVKDLKWENSIEVKLGYLFYSEEVDGETEQQNKKNADAFKINSKVGYKAIKNWYYTLSLDINSQFFEGMDKKNETVISGFLSPGQVYLAAGMDYKYKKTYSVFVSPLTYKNTMVIDPSNDIKKRYGVLADEVSKKELGGYIRGSLKWEINPDLTWNSKVYLFSNYRENPENIDLDFENVLDYKFSHVFSLRFFVQIKYDDDTKFEVGEYEDGTKRLSPRLQFKQQMSIGLFYRF